LSGAGAITLEQPIGVTSEGAAAKGDLPIWRGVGDLQKQKQATQQRGFPKSRYRFPSFLLSVRQHYE
jgi:hypothetical protein